MMLVSNSAYAGEKKPNVSELPEALGLSIYHNLWKCDAC